MSKSENGGGLPVCRLPALTGTRGSSQGITLISDPHIGSALTDYDRLARDLAAADLAGDRILLGGDIFDLILPSDRKRFCPSAVHSRVLNRDDMVGESVRWADEIFGPYVGRIDAVGIGNHETAALKAHSIDAVKALCEKMGGVGSSPQQAGYTAYLHYPVEGATRGYTIWYTHGAGRAKTAASALNFLLDKSAAWEADLYWCGHFHSRATCAEVGTRLGPNGPESRDIRCVVSGSYQDPYRPQTQDDMKARGRKSNFAAEGAMRSHGLGCTRVVLHWGRKGAISRVEVVQ